MDLVRALPLALVLGLLAALPARAQVELLAPDRGRGYTLEAEEVVYEPERGVYEASGNVRIVQPGGRKVFADWVAFNPETGVGVATGNVRIQDAADEVTAEFVALDLNSTLAMATRATLDTQSPGLTVRGGTIKRTGVDRYHVTNANLTTCRCQPADGTRPWEVDVAEADLQVGGYGVAKHVWFRAFGVPIFYFPAVIFPVKTERQTGLLMPRVGQSSRNGTEIELPVFWAARDNLNLTLVPTFLSKRGFKGGLELETVWSEQAYAEGGAYGIRGDDEVDSDDFETPFSDNRWGTWLRLHQPFGAGSRLGLKVEETSDNQYVIDFEDLPGPVRNQRFLSSSGWLTAGGGGLFGGVTAAGYDDLQNPDDLDRDDTVLQRVADVLVAALPRRLAGWPVRLGVDVRDIYFWQKDHESTILGNAPLNGQFFDTGADALFNGQERTQFGTFLGPAIDVYQDDGITEDNGIFDEGEILADYGNRFEVYPTLAVPLRLGPLETYSEVGWRATFYSPDEASTEKRGILTARFDTRLRFARDYRVGGAPLRHLLEPRVSYALVDAPDQSDNPLFVPDFSERLERLFDSDLRLLTRNPSDRVPDQSFLLVGIGNRFYAGEAGGGDTSLVGEVTVGWNYDFERDASSRLFLDSLMTLSSAWQGRFEIGWNPKESELDDVLVGVGWVPDAERLIGLRYRYVRDIPLTFESFPGVDIYDSADRDEDHIAQLSGELLWPLLPTLSLFGSGYLDLESSGSNSGRVGVILDSDCRCWELVTTLTHDTRGDDTRLEFVLRLAGLGRRANQRPELP